jgi:hypothetical protein
MIAIFFPQKAERAASGMPRRRDCTSSFAARRAAGVEKRGRKAALVSGSMRQLPIPAAHLPNSVASNFGGMMQGRYFNGLEGSFPGNCENMRFAQRRRAN